jgi:hypothetical protein
VEHEWVDIAGVQVSYDITKEVAFSAAERADRDHAGSGDQPTRERRTISIDRGECIIVPGLVNFHL